MGDYLLASGRNRQIVGTKQACTRPRETASTSSNNRVRTDLRRSLTAIFRRDFADIERYAIQLQELSRPKWVAWGCVSEGLFLAHSGKPTEGIDKIEAGLRLTQGIGSTVLHPVFLSGLADAQLMDGKFLAAAETID